MHYPSHRAFAHRAPIGVAAALLLFVLPTHSVAQTPDSASRKASPTPPPALLRAVRVTPNPAWKCQIDAQLVATHGVDAVVCDTRFRAAAIRAALAEHQSLGASDVCARTVADQLERAVPSWAAADTITAKQTESVACDGHVLTSDSLRYDDRAVLRVCPGRVWSWVERGSVDCSAIQSALAHGVSMASTRAPRTKNERKAHDLARSARDWYVENQFTKSRNLAERAVKLDSLSAPAQAVLGASLSMLGQYDSAATYLERAVALDPSDEWCWGMLAQTLYFGGADSALARAANEALAANGNNAEVLGYLGMSQLRTGASQEAAGTLNHAVTLAPDDARFHAAFARALRLTGHGADAEREARNAIRLASNYSEGYAELGQALEAEGRTPDAIEAYRKAHQLAEWNSEVNARLSALGAKP
jgi:Flp pilus assembly protein TadD